MFKPYEEEEDLRAQLVSCILPLDGDQFDTKKEFKNLSQ